MHNFGVMAQVLLTGENRFLSPRDFKELGVVKRSRSTTSARPALQQPWSIIGRTNFLRPRQTSILSNRNCLKLLVKMITACPIARYPSFKILDDADIASASRARPFCRDHHTRRQSHTASMDELACSEFMFWRSCSGYRTHGWATRAAGYRAAI
jgi:hypothetical protein